MSAELEELLRPPGEVTVRPVPEHLADAELTKVYQDLKATLAVPWVGVITQAVAHYRPFLLKPGNAFSPLRAPTTLSATAMPFGSGRGRRWLGHSISGRSHNN